VKPFDWNELKNAMLTAERGVSFEDVQTAVEKGNLLDVITHPNQRKYPGQKLLIIRIGNYVFVVPCIENEKALFLKTIYPSRKFTKKYLIE
jgi:uncharacterized DUF497 family protein